MSNKYWENETPIVTETEFGGISYFKEAGKIQLYSVYEKDGELMRGKGCTWDNNEMEADDVIRLVYALMQGLIDVGVESDAFSDAYSLLQDAVNGIEDADDSEEEDDAEETLDEEFEDEIPDYNEMKLNDLKEIATNRGLELPKRVTKQALVKLLEADDESSEEEESGEEDGAEEQTSFVGKNIKYVDGEVSKVKKSVKKDYIEWAEDAIEWANYMAEGADELSKMPTKTVKQKKAQDKAYAELDAEVKEWLEEWGDDVDKVSGIVKDIMLHNMNPEVAIVKFLVVIDAMKF